MTEPAQVVSFRMAPDVLTALRDIANEQGCTVSDLMRRGALMALEEPNRMVITWTSPPVVSLEPATTDLGGPVGPGEGGGTGAGEREAHRTAEGALDAAIEAVTIAIHDLDCDRDCGDSLTTMSPWRLAAQAAVRAAEPILRQAVAEEIRALQSRVTELESQRHAVLEACDRVERDEPSAVFSQGGPVWAIWTADIRAAYEEDDDA